MKKKFFMTFAISIIAFSLMYARFYNLNFVSGSNQVNERIGNENEMHKLKEDNEILFLFCGVDSIDITEQGTRTDTMMVIRTSFETGEISILSVPRDTRVLINDKVRKINSAHAIGGMPLAISTVNSLLGLDIQYYVKADYQVVMDIVDIIGGVEVNVPFLMEYKDPNSIPPLDIYIEEGWQLLDGKNAHDFLRWRKNNNRTVQYPEGDVGRIKTQQYFLTELIKQTLNSNKLIKKLPSIASTYFKNVETNLPLSKILEGIELAKNLDVDDISTEILPGEGVYIGPISYFIHDEEKTKELIYNLYNDSVGFTTQSKELYTNFQQ